MNVLKHMEAIFVVTLAFAGSVGFAAHTLPEAHSQEVHANAQAIATPGGMAVVTVTAKRMSTIEKTLSLLEEGKAAGSRG